MSFAPYVCIQTHNKCYKNTKPMEVKGVLWHSTGCNNPNLKRYVQPYAGDSNYDEAIAKLGKNKAGNDWNHTSENKGVNAFIGKFADGSVGTVQTMPWNYRPWGCAGGSKGSCNNGWIQFEICEDNLTNKEYAQKVWDEAIALSVYLCQMYNLDPSKMAKNGKGEVPVITCHHEAHEFGYASGHMDIDHWFPKILGKNMDNARSEIYAILMGAKKPVSEPIVSTPVQNQTAHSANPYKKPTSAINVGAKGNAVKWIQYQLNTFKYGLKVDGAYGPATKKAVVDFQSKNSLPLTGNCDLNTIKVLNGEKINTQPAKLYTVKVTAGALNIRKGPGTNYATMGVIKNKGTYDIIEEKNGWGKLKINNGWISLKYTKKV